MLVAGYFGEAVYTTGSGPAVWGLISGIAYFYIVYEIWLGGASKLAAAAGGAAQSAQIIMLVCISRLGNISYWVYGWN